MVNESELKKKIESDYHKKLKELESKLAAEHKELTKVERTIQHEAKKIYGSTHSSLSKFKTEKLEIDARIRRLKKEIKHLRNDYVKKLKKL